MNEYLNENVCQFDNDASASSFGWNFQTNAGIFLFLKYMPEVTDIKIESKSQDIEMTLENNGKVFAQAKSSQDYTAIKDQKEKFKDAIISLARNPYEGNQLIYIIKTKKSAISGIKQVKCRSNRRIIDPPTPFFTLNHDYQGRLIRHLLSVHPWDDSPEESPVFSNAPYKLLGCFQ